MLAENMQLQIEWSKMGNLTRHAWNFQHTQPLHNILTKLLLQNGLFTFQHGPRPFLTYSLCFQKGCLHDLQMPFPPLGNIVEPAIMSTHANIVYTWVVGKKHLGASTACLTKHMSIWRQLCGTEYLSLGTNTLALEDLSWPYSKKLEPRVYMFASSDFCSRCLSTFASHTFSPKH